MAISYSTWVKKEAGGEEMGRIDLFNSLGITMFPQSRGEVIPATEAE